MLSNVKSLIVSNRYCTSIINLPFGFNIENAALAISSNPSAWANTFDAVIRSANPYSYLIYWAVVSVKKPLIVLK